MELEYINAIAIIVIFVVLGIHIVYTVYLKIKHENNMRNLQNELHDVQTDIEKMKLYVIQNLKRYVESKSMSILDLDEFSKLDPFAKDLYKNYIVDQIMPAIMESINNDMKSANIEQQYISYKKEIDDVVSELVNDIKANGFMSLMTKMNSSKTTNTTKRNFDDEEPLIVVDKDGNIIRNDSIFKNNDDGIYYLNKYS